MYSYENDKEHELDYYAYVISNLDKSENPTITQLANIMRGLYLKADKLEQENSELKNKWFGTKKTKPCHDERRK